MVAHCSAKMLRYQYAGIGPTFDTRSVGEGSSHLGQFFAKNSYSPRPHKGFLPGSPPHLSISINKPTSEENRDLC